MATSSVQLSVYEIFGGSVSNVPFQNFLASVSLTGFRTVVEEITSSRNSHLNVRPNQAAPLVMGPGIETRVALLSSDGERTVLHGPSNTASPRIRRARNAVLELNDWGIQIRASDIFMRNLTAHAYFTEWPFFAVATPFPELELAESRRTASMGMTVEGSGSVIIDCVGSNGDVHMRRKIEVGANRRAAASCTLPLELEIDGTVAQVAPRIVASSDASLSVGGSTFDEFAAARCRKIGLTDNVLRDARLPQDMADLLQGSMLSVDL